MRVVGRDDRWPYVNGHGSFHVVRRFDETVAANLAPVVESACCLILLYSSRAQKTINPCAHKFVVFVCCFCYFVLKRDNNYFRFQPNPFECPNGQSPLFILFRFGQIERFRKVDTQMDTQIIMYRFCFWYKKQASLVVIDHWFYSQFIFLNVICYCTLTVNWAFLIKIKSGYVWR